MSSLMSQNVTIFLLNTTNSIITCMSYYHSRKNAMHVSPLNVHHFILKKEIYWNINSHGILLVHHIFGANNTHCTTVVSVVSCLSVKNYKLINQSISQIGVQQQNRYSCCVTSMGHRGCWCLWEKSQVKEMVFLKIFPEDYCWGGWANG